MTSVAYMREYSSDAVAIAIDRRDHRPLSSKLLDSIGNSLAADDRLDGVWIAEEDHGCFLQAAVTAPGWGRDRLVQYLWPVIERAERESRVKLALSIYDESRFDVVPRAIKDEFQLPYRVNPGVTLGKRFLKAPPPRER